jgi:hypothetical protein
MRSINTKTYNLNSFNKDCEKLLDQFDSQLSEKLIDNTIQAVTKVLIWF